MFNLIHLYESNKGKQVLGELHLNRGNEFMNLNVLEVLKEFKQYFEDLSLLYSDSVD